MPEKGCRNQRVPILLFQKRIENSVFVSLALVLQAANMYLSPIECQKKEKATDRQDL
jgi:hypothetical protein